MLILCEAWLANTISPQAHTSANSELGWRLKLICLRSKDTYLTTTIAFYTSDLGGQCTSCCSKREIPVTHWWRLFYERGVFSMPP